MKRLDSVLKHDDLNSIVEPSRSNYEEIEYDLGNGQPEQRRHW
jgi:hypothetical protein